MCEEGTKSKNSVDKCETKPKNKSSFDSGCPATTSRGISQSSGDCDGSDYTSNGSGKCSCESETLHSVMEKPCSIVDSSTMLHRSKWKTIKKFISYQLKGALPVCRSRRAGRHARVPFTAAQASALEAAYSRAPYLAPPALRALAAALQLRDDRIKIWFQNRRARERREKSVNIAPPHAITLPPTTLASSITPNSWIPHTADTRINEGQRNEASFTNMQRHVRITETIDAHRHDVVFTRQRLSFSQENAARYLNTQNMPSLFSYKVESDDDDGSLDIETVED